MAISKDEVKYIAQLAKLHFEEDEAEKFAKEFEKIFPKDLQKQTSGANVVQNVK